MKQFEILVNLPSGKTLTLSLFAESEDDHDLNFIFAAFCSAARYNDCKDPQLFERTNRVVK